LARIASAKGLELLVADNLCLPYATACFDAVLSVAVIHHFASVERRCMALQELSRIVRPGGVALIYVWAYEQKNKHGEARFKQQDVMIPWHLQKRFKGSALPSTSVPVSTTTTPERGLQTTGKNGEIRFNRYYHVFREGELESLVESVPERPFEIMERGYEHDNWYVIVKRVQSHCE
jgi:SAM-dependent methyltransferase